MLVSELNQALENLGLDLELDDEEQFLIKERKTGNKVSGFDSLDDVYAALTVAQTVLK